MSGAVKWTKEEMNALAVAAEGEASASRFLSSCRALGITRSPGAVYHRVVDVRTRPAGVSEDMVRSLWKVVRKNRRAKVSSSPKKARAEKPRGVLDDLKVEPRA